MKSEIKCKKCNGSKCVKNGKVRGKQRYVCRSCSYNFILGDKRLKISKAKLALVMLLYGHGRSSMRFLAKLCDVSPQCILTWIRNESRKLSEPEVPEKIKDIEMDEMWHFIGSKKNKFGYGKPYVVRRIELLHGWSATVTLSHAKSYTTR